MANFRFGDPNLFCKGVADVTVTDTKTGDIRGYSKVLSEAAVTIDMNMGDITGGLNNALLIRIPDSVRLSGTLTSQAFSLDQRALAVGGAVEYNGITRTCLGEVSATDGVLYIPNDYTPVRSYGQSASDEKGWCYVHEHGAQKYSGKNSKVSLTADANGYAISEIYDADGNIIAVDSTKTYDITFFERKPSVQTLPIPTDFSPFTGDLSIKYNIYAKQNGRENDGTLAGHLYLIVPQAQFNADGVGLSASQTENATTSYSWEATMPDTVEDSCSDCGTTSSNYAYYVYVPCGDITQSVIDLIVVGDGVSVEEGGTVKCSVLYYMPNEKTAKPRYTDLSFESSDTSIATVSNETGSEGVITGVAAGDCEITVTLKSDTTKKAVCNVTVTA